MYWDTNTVWDCNGTASPSNPAFCGGRNTEMIAYEGAITANRDPDKYATPRRFWVPARTLANPIAR